jgi:hypothetical protein
MSFTALHTQQLLIKKFALVKNKLHWICRFIHNINKQTKDRD